MPEVVPDLVSHEPVLSLTLAPDSRKALADFSTANIGRRVDLRIDGTIVLSPVIREPLQSDKVEISGSDIHELRDIAAHLRAGESDLEIDLRSR